MRGAPRGAKRSLRSTRGMRVLARARIPLVDLNDRFAPLGAPRIESNQQDIGILAADHLLERGFTRFAFCGFSDQAWSIGRRQGFVQRLKERSLECNLWETPWTGRRAHPWEREQTHIARWLTSLSRPTGIMACN